MVATKTLRVLPDSELSTLLREAAESGEPLVVDTGDAAYVLDVMVDRFHGEPLNRTPTPEEVERSRAGILASAGGWRDNVDVEALKEYLRERRRTPGRAAGNR